MLRCAKHTGYQASFAHFPPEILLSRSADAESSRRSSKVPENRPWTGDSAINTTRSWPPCWSRASQLQARRQRPQAWYGTHVRVTALQRVPSVAGGRQVNGLCTNAAIEPPQLRMRERRQWVAQAAIRGLRPAGFNNLRPEHCCAPRRYPGTCGKQTKPRMAP
jgi:hypothetical protein